MREQDYQNAMKEALSGRPDLQAFIDGREDATTTITMKDSEWGMIMVLKAIVAPIVMHFLETESEQQLEGVSETTGRPLTRLETIAILNTVAGMVDKVEEAITPGFEDMEKVKEIVHLMEQARSNVDLLHGLDLEEAQ